MVRQSLLFQGTDGCAVLFGAAVGLEVALFPGCFPSFSNWDDYVYADTEFKESSLWSFRATALKLTV